MGEGDASLFGVLDDGCCCHVAWVAELVEPFGEVDLCLGPAFLLFVFVADGGCVVDVVYEQFDCVWYPADPCVGSLES